MVFHFNKGHLKDPTIPMWVIKAKGQSFYVDHVVSELPWSTKETPDNESTKGSIKIRQCHLVIDDQNTAYLKPLTQEIIDRLNNPQVVIRVMTAHGDRLRKATENLDHVGIKTIGGGCGTLFYITEFNSDEQYVLFKMSMDANTSWRELKPNEDYYKLYEKYKTSLESHIDTDEYYDEDDEDEDLYES